MTIGPSPPWLKARLMACGQRPINNVVDITNYVMLLTGQPMHAFDLDRIEGGRLVVRRATDGEQVVTLDDQTRTVDGEVCLIADAAGPTSIAGVMGGNRSEVQPDTTRVLMEAANWNAANIHATSLKLGLRSEASARFEKGLAPEQALDGQAVATQLMLELTGARLVPGTIDVGGAGADPLVVRLRDKKVVALLGVAITRSESALHLQRLGFETAERADGLDVTVPYFRRNDVTREADLVEEVARLHGVNDQLPATLPSRRGAVGVLTVAQRLRRRAEDVLAGRGLLEVVGWSFESVARDDRLRLPADDPRRAHVVIENPMSEDESVLRTTLLGSLLHVARHNAARGQGVPGIFESGRVYVDAGGTLPNEHHALGALLPGDVFAAKAHLEALLGALRVPAAFAADPQPFLHPGRSAAVLAGGVPVGWVGDVHPLVAAQWDLERRRRLRDRPRRGHRACRAGRAVRGPHVVSRAARGHRGRRRRGRARGHRAGDRARRRRQAARARRGLRRLPRRADPRRAHLAGDRADVPRPRPHAHRRRRRARAREDRRAAGRRAGR